MGIKDSDPLIYGARVAGNISAVKKKPSNTSGHVASNAA